MQFLQVESVFQCHAFNAVSQSAGRSSRRNCSVFSRFAVPVLYPSRVFVTQSCCEALYRPSLPTHSSRLLLHHRTVTLPTSIPVLRNHPPLLPGTGRELRDGTRGFGTQTQHERDHAHLSEEMVVTPGRWPFKCCYKATKFTCIKTQRIRFR